MTKNRFLLLLWSVFHLSKAGISFSVALTTATGYLLSTRIPDIQIIYPFTGVLFLAMAASALNQFQELKSDRLMVRTSKRPLVNNTLSVKFSLTIITIFFIAGAGILFIANGLIPALLGILNLLWYNGVYTPLKYRTAFAAVPGGIVGAIPPVIGWVAGGGNLFHASALSLAVFFFIGQIPHFWIIILKYSSEYESAGIKSITSKFSTLQIRRLIFTWVLATALSGSLMAFFIIINHNETFYLIHLFSLLLIIYFINWLLQKNNHHSSRAFISINLYYLLIMILIITDIVFK